MASSRLTDRISTPSLSSDPEWHKDTRSIPGFRNALTADKPLAITILYGDRIKRNEAALEWHETTARNLYNLIMQGLAEPVQQFLHKEKGNGLSTDTISLFLSEKFRFDKNLIIPYYFGYTFLEEAAYLPVTPHMVDDRIGILREIISWGGQDATKALQIAIKAQQPQEIITFLKEAVQIAEKEKERQRLLRIDED